MDERNADRLKNKKIKGRNIEERREEEKDIERLKKVITETVLIQGRQKEESSDDRTDK